jgi:predicted DNA-binding ribbon-helix-helix protein
MKHIERVQTGLRIERRLLKVLKGLAEHLDISVAELVEAIALHSFEGKAPFSAATMEKIRQLKAVYDLDLGAEDSHRLTEDGGEKNA